MLAAALATASPLPALAYGTQGHKIVATIAWSYMSSAARARADQLLSEDPDTLTKPDFVSRSLWADMYRSSNGRAYSQTAKWHFVNIPSGLTDNEAIRRSIAELCPAASPAPASAGSPNSCIVTKLQEFEAELSSPSTSEAEKILALKYVLHLVGDVSEPLHAVGDAGGNCIWVSTGGRSFKLHEYWDNQAVEENETSRNAISNGVALAREITAAEIREWSQDDPTKWAVDSYLIAQNVALQLSVDQVPTCYVQIQYAPIRLSEAYQAAAVGTTRRQLNMAGVRLAYILNTRLR